MNNKETASEQIEANSVSSVKKADSILNETIVSKKIGLPYPKNATLVVNDEDNFSCLSSENSSSKKKPNQINSLNKNSVKKVT